MARYIDADELVKEILSITIMDKYVAGYAEAVFDRIANMPTADVKEIPKTGIEDLSDGY